VAPAVVVMSDAEEAAVENRRVPALMAVGPV
jgi:hypothetical protein